MAITMKNNNLSVIPFFKHLGLIAKYNEFMAAHPNAVFTIEFMQLKVAVPVQHGLTISEVAVFEVNTSTVMKSPGYSGVVVAVRAKVGQLLNKVSLCVAHPAQPAAGISIDIDPEVPPNSTTMPKKPTKLYATTTLGAPVFGTSSGSVYYVVGYGPRLRMAIRAGGSKLSVRFEGDLSLAEKAALTGMNFKDGNGDGNGYWSAHFNTTTLVPPGRIIGGLFFTPGLEFLVRSEHPEAYFEI